MAAPASSSRAPVATTLPPPALPIPTFSSLSDSVALARISVLLVPVGEIDKERWDLWTEKIRGYTEIKLSDVPGTSGTAARSGKARFLPPSHPPPTTSLHLSFITTPPPTSVLPLSLFRISACPLAVIGLSDLSDSEATHANQIEQFENALEEIGLGGSNGGIYPLAKRCFGVEEDVMKREAKGYLVDEEPLSVPPSRSSQDPISRSGTPGGTPRRIEQSSQFEGVVEIDASDEVVDPTIKFADAAGREVPVEGKKYYDRKGHEEKMVVIPKDGNVDLVLGMLMTDLCASVLTEFGEIATALESPAGVQAVQSSLLPTLTLKPVPVGLTTAHRPKSGNWCHIAVTNNASPVGGSMAGPSRSTSPAPSNNSTSTTSFLSSQPNLHDQESRDRVGPLRPASVLGTNESSTAKAFTNTPLPETSKADNRTSTGASIKRPSSGFGFGSNVSRVLSGKGLGNGDGMSHSSSLVGMGGHSHTGSISSSTSGGGASSSGSGRVKKLLGDLWLLSGRLSEAISSFSEAGVSLKGQGDTFWHASAMEGLATASLLEAWEVRDRQNDAVIPFTASAILSNIHDNFYHAFMLYSRSPRPPDSLFPHGHESGEGSIANLYVSCALKLARTMLLVWSAGGFGTAALTGLVTGTMPKVYPPMTYKARWRVLLKLSTMSKISRHAVSRIAARAHGPFLAALPTAVQLDTFVTLVGIDRLLGLDRREIYHAREAIGLSLALILEGRLLSPTSAIRSTDADELKEGRPLNRPGGTSPHAEPLFDNGGEVAIRAQETTAGNAGILSLISRVLDIAGLSLSESDDAGERDPPKLLFGWPEVQVEVLREAVSAAELLPDQDAVMRFSAMGLKHLVEFLSPAAQFKLHEIFIEAVFISSRRGISQANNHWWLAGDLVTGMELIPFAANRIPYEQVRAGEGNPDAGPFLYNPRTKLADSGQVTLVGNEAFDVAVEVTNPFSFDLDIRSLSLVTSGVSCEARPLRFILPANTVQMVRLAGIAGDAGRIKVDGCRVVLQDGAEKMIGVPARNVNARFKRDRQRMPLHRGIVKTLGLNARPGRQMPIVLEASETHSHDVRAITCDVISPQPLLWIRSTSLIHGSVITYHGERSAIVLVLENTSMLSVNLLQISFEDNTTVAGLEILAEGSLPAGPAHQLGSDLYERPVLSVDKSNLKDIDIPPGSSYTITIDCLGKLGCERATIDLNYGHMSDSTLSPLYSRRISLPVLFTVHPTLECSSISVIPWSSASITDPKIVTELLASPEGDQQTIKKVVRPAIPLHHHSSYRQEKEMTTALRKELLMPDPAEDLCVVLLDLFNRSSSSLEFALERLLPGQNSAAGNNAESAMRETSSSESLILRRLVAPGAVERIPLPLPRKCLASSSLLAPIPRFGTRQFVLSAIDADNGAPEYLSDFWYRQDLITQLKGWWTNPASGRAGEVVFLHSEVGGHGLSHYRASTARPTLQFQDAEGIVADKMQVNDFGVLHLSIGQGFGDLSFQIMINADRDLRGNPLDRVDRHLLFDEPLEGRMSTGLPTAIGFIALTSGTYWMSAIVRCTGTAEEWMAEPIRLTVDA